jgi:monofunctional biosynthetic peptidoglycan transglycosylase
MAGAAAPPRPFRDFESGVEPVASSRVLHGALRVGVGFGAAVVVLLLGLILLYRFVDPPTSMLMLIQRLGGTGVHQRWVPLARIAPVLPLAVIASEDARFCYHRGVDWGELAEAIESSREGMARGGSTITMQVVKNLFLWPSRSYVRKALEIPLAYAVELLWSKRRILEVYLNVAEWGPGIFGAETAALYHFRKPASLLTLREAALLAVSLPNPAERQAGRPGPGLIRLANRLAARMHVEAGSACLRAPR